MNFRDDNFLDDIILDFIESLAVLRVDKRISDEKKFLLIHKYLQKMLKEYKNLINED